MLDFSLYLGHPHLPSPVVTNNDASASSQVSDSVIFPPPRFAALTKNIRCRRGNKVKIQRNIYQDRHTVEQECDMDCMAYGMGSCCLQVTYQAVNLAEAQKMFDAMMVLTPLMLSASAAAPIYRGKLLTTDTRWEVISQSVDDRTPEELAKPNSTSRYNTSTLYMSEGGSTYNDVPVEYNRPAFSILQQIGMDPLLATPLSHLLTKDPHLVYPEHLQKCDDNRFQMLQSTVWQDVRLKLPKDSTDSWKMEFRPMEIQLSDTDNVALLLFTTVYLRTVLEFNLDYRLPISSLLKNVTTSEQMDSCRSGRFYQVVNGQVRYLTLAEIFMNPTHGVWWKMIKYIVALHYEATSKFALLEYLAIIISRFQGTRLTDARRIREYVINHPGYQGDSQVSKEIMDDLVKAGHHVGLANNTLEQSL